MQFCIIAYFILVTLASAKAVPSLNASASVAIRRNDLDGKDSHELLSDGAGHGTATVQTGLEFDKAGEIGRVLFVAMRSKDSVARWFFKNYPYFADTVQSPWDGDLRADLRTWGYRDDEELSKTIEHECDFDQYHHMRPVFDDLDLDTKAKVDGGPNECFRIDHMNGPAIKRNPDGTLPSVSQQYYEVCGKQYRATGATFEFAVNANGAIVLSNVLSAVWSAKSPLMWGRTPAIDELPQLRSTSDMAWGVWNRAAPHNLRGIKYLMVTNIINPGTREVIRSALEGLDPPQSTKVWPGHEFNMDSKEGQAILGSPVGRWAGYFLIQHKVQLGVFYVNPAPVLDSVSTPGPADTLSMPVLGPTNSIGAVSKDISRETERIHDDDQFVKVHFIGA